MKRACCLLLFLLVMVTSNFAQPFDFQLQSETFQPLPFGAVRPAGWLREQMQADVAGFVGNLDQVVPALINDPIYSERLHKNSRLQDLGNLKAGDAEGDEQYKWWNSETQSNWWDGYLRNVLLLGDTAGIAKGSAYIARILATQDADGYLGIYDRDLRYQFTSENGELWAKTTLYRGLLAWYEATGDTTVWQALLRAVDEVMAHYPVNQSDPFNVGKEFTGGVAHGLTFTDVCDRLYLHTGEEKYRRYALFLYQNFSQNFSFEKDIQLENILSAGFTLKGHGAHTYEHLRPLAVAAYSSSKPELKEALRIYLHKVEDATTPAGGPIGDEWIGGRKADATHTGYEYCSIHELMTSYTDLLQKAGSQFFGDEAERIFYNAAQGSRHPQHSCIAYLKTDNSYEMQGSRNGVDEHDRKQTRYKYSPAHQDVAVCCNPNAGRITPYFVQSMWMKEGANTLVATLLGPSVLETTVGGEPVVVREITAYPNENSFVFQVSPPRHTRLTLKIRKPGWVTKVVCDQPFTETFGFLVFDLPVGKETEIHLTYQAKVVVHQVFTEAPESNIEAYFSHGALVYARPVAAKEVADRPYFGPLRDYLYAPVSAEKFMLAKMPKPAFVAGNIEVNLVNVATGKSERVALVPVGRTILRQVTFVRP